MRTGHFEPARRVIERLAFFADQVLLRHAKIVEGQLPRLESEISDLGNRRAVHAEADFDHALYYQALAEPAGAARMDRTMAPARDFMDTARAHGTIDPAKRCFKMRLFGTLPNQDTWIRDPA